MEEFWLNFMTKADLHLDYILNQKEAKVVKEFPNYDQCAEHHVKSHEKKWANPKNVYTEAFSIPKILLFFSALYNQM